MSLYLKIIYKFIFLAILLVVMSIVYTKFFYESDVQEHSKIINLVRDLPPNTDVIYIGESSNTTAGNNDLDQRPISDFIGDYYPSLTVSHITKPASHAGIYIGLLEQIPKDAPISTVIVTLNLRSFDAGWIYSELETALQKSLVLLQDYPPFVNRFLLSFKAYDIKTKKERENQVFDLWKRKLSFPYDFPYQNVREWDRAMAKKGIKDKNGKWNQDLTNLACHYIKNYAFQIDTLHNPRIKDFDAIVTLAKKRNWHLVFNLLAEDTEQASKLVGKDLLFLMEQNRKLLVDYYTRKGVLVVDNLYAVDNNQFIDQNWTTEHYAEKGRRIIAKNVAEDLQKFYPKEFEKIEETVFYQTDFFNNCEGNSIWLQMNTLSEKYAFSGKKSSPTGNGNDFSITLSYPLANLPDSLKNEVNIQLQALALSPQHQASIVFEALGEKSKPYWKSFSLKPFLKTTKKWEKVAISFSLPEEVKNAERIKIYVYNPAKGEVMIDDFGIMFY